MNPGRQRGEQAEQGEGRRGGRPRREEQRALLGGDRHALRPVARPVLRAPHRLRDQGQPGQPGQHERLEHQVGDLQRVPGVLGQQPGDQRPQPQPAQVGGGGGDLRATPRRAAGTARVQLAEVGGGRGGQHADADARDDPPDEQSRHRGPAQEQQAGRHVDGDRGRRHPPPPDPVGQVPGQEQAGHHPDRVGGEHHGHHERAEPVPRLVEHVQRGGHRGEGHGDQEDERDQPEPLPAVRRRGTTGLPRASSPVMRAAGHPGQRRQCAHQEAPSHGLLTLLASAPPVIYANENYC